MSGKILLPAALMATAAIFGACSGDKATKEQVKPKPVEVVLGSASTANADAVLASGQVEAAQTAGVSTRMMGRITNIYVKAGDHVSKGQVLATISDEDMRAKRAQTNAMIAEAEAAYAAAQKDFDRFTNLYKEQSATAKELDNVTLQYNAAKSRVEAAKQMRNEVNAMLSYSSITAPFAGVVTQKLSEVGAVANPGMPILTIEQTGILQVSAAVAESDVSNVHLGDEVDMEIKSTGKKNKGRVIQLNPSSQFTGGQYLVKVSIPDADKKDMLAGMFVNVSIPVKEKAVTETTDKVLVPLASIVRREELTGIYTVGSGNAALLRWLRLGKVYGDKVEVISGLGPNEHFVLSASDKLYNGAPVVITKQ